jgi:hypothetical protein
VDPPQSTWHHPFIFLPPITSLSYSFHHSHPTFIYATSSSVFFTSLHVSCIFRELVLSFLSLKKTQHHQHHQHQLCNTFSVRLSLSLFTIPLASPSIPALPAPLALAIQHWRLVLRLSRDIRNTHSFSKAFASCPLPYTSFTQILHCLLAVSLLLPGFEDH